MWWLLTLVGCAVVLRAAADGEAPLRCRDPRCRYTGMIKPSVHQYEVDGGKLLVQYIEIKILKINCFGTNALESTDMPRADHVLRARDVVINQCPLPRNGSILDKLNWLNITMLLHETKVIREHSPSLTIEGIPPLSLLTTKLFIGLENLAGLNIKVDEDNQVTAERYFLSPLKNLSSLKIQRVTIADDELNDISSKLQVLSLTQTGIKHLSKAVYASSSLLDVIVESDIALDAVAIPPSLQSLELKSPATTLLVNSVPALKKMDITNWTEKHPQPLTSCDKLKKINLNSPAVHTLPNRWLANCSNLKVLVIEKALNLTELPKRLFGFSIHLIALREGVLESLNEGQFDGDRGPIMVFELYLNSNRLQIIPNASLPPHLDLLDLSSNDLDSSVLDKLAGMVSPSFLNLGDNPRLGDSCDKHGYSPIRRHGHVLKTLELYNTNVSRLCRDWQEDMPVLEKLDLRNTSVSRLTFEDLQFTRTVQAKVLLEGAPVTLLEMTSGDVERAKRTPPSGAFIDLGANARFQCDCSMYWTRRVLEQFPRALDNVSRLRCMNGKILNESMVEEMVCARPEECAAAGLPDTCTCSERPDDDTARDRQLLRVDCTNTALTYMPRLAPAEDRLYELLLADNQITDLHAKDLDNVKILDLRKNSIAKVDNKTAGKLSKIGGMLWLAGNPLDCDCSAAPLILMLRSRNPEYTDLRHITCSDGTALQDAPAVECPPSIAGYVASLAVLSALAVAVTVCLASRERRFFARAVLHRWGCLCCLDVDEDDRRYDAFITFSHKDEDIAFELMMRLEPSYQLCVHHRDWIPGLPIPDQIVKSVRESRRTLALVSRHFLTSSWARAEFREAHEAAMLDARPRLVVILLEDPAALALDKQLQRYIATHTYLRWGDPWFYDKLAVVLPRPRLPHSVTDPSHLAPSAGGLVHLRALEQNRSPSHEHTVVEVLTPLMPVIESLEQYNNI